MMVSPEAYASFLQKKSYEELIKERDSLIFEIKKYGKMPDDFTGISHSKETIYKYNHLYLSKVCDLLSEKLGDMESKNQPEKVSGNEWLHILKKYLMEDNLSEVWINTDIELRRKGKEYSLSDHIKGLIYSLLSSQRPWKGIVANQDSIRNIFYDFDVSKIKNENPERFIKELCQIKCGNRNINRQMEALPQNIAIMEEIEKGYGSMDNFVTSAPAHEIVKKISASNSKYKLQGLGEALAWEYLRNVGIDGMKPDVHLCRFFAGNRMGDGNNSPATMHEVYETVLKLSKDTGMPMSEIDSLVWNFCSSGYGEICTSEPSCEMCPIRKYCNKSI